MRSTCPWDLHPRKHPSTERATVENYVLPRGLAVEYGKQAIPLLRPSSHVHPPQVYVSSNVFR